MINASLHVVLDGYGADSAIISMQQGLINQIETLSNSFLRDPQAHIVAPSLRSGCYSLGSSGLLKRVETLDSVSNY